MDADSRMDADSTLLTSPGSATPRAVLGPLRGRIVLVAVLPLVLVVAVAMLIYFQLDEQATAEQARTMLRYLIGAALIALPVAGVVAAGIGARLLADVRDPLVRMRGTLMELSDGDLTARTGLSGDDEIRSLGVALDDLLEQRISGLDRAARESEELNDSVIAIMQAVGTIATSKDLTIRVPVTENVTGAIADALNLLTDETRRVLVNVRNVSDDVAQATIAVQTQSGTASRAAAREQREVEMAARELAAAAAALKAIAERARSCDDAAERAVQASVEAMRIVGSTVHGVEQSRSLIRETEKRIKRLGERSQEIGQVVGIIAAIAERTGILALNASMQAAASGEAGRSFAVVADEVKRLSESARDATTQIGRLVTSIQTETNDTVLAMNQAISQVVEISRLAEQAGAGMRRNQDETEALAANVRDIARTSAEQATVGAALFERARSIQEASGETERQLSLQAAETVKLVDSANSLLDEVSVFRVTTR